MAGRYVGCAHANPHRSFPLILVTGSNGFVGAHLCLQLRERAIAVRAAGRAGAHAADVIVGSLGRDTDWRAALAGCDCVIHLAARVHVMDDKHDDPLHAFRAANVEGTVALARQAWEAGVRRFVFVSSVKVHGESTTGGAPFLATDPAAPADPYGLSKLEAELALQALARETGLELVIVRPPLVYGPGVRANFLSLIRLVATGVPLPFGLAKGLRSLVAVDNLVDLLILCSSHPNAIGKAFLVSDGADVSVAKLVRMLAQGMGKSSVLFPVPVAWMVGMAKMAGKSAVADRLFGSLQVNIAQTTDILDWKPIISMQAAIDQTVLGLRPAPKQEIQ